jgi:hypothetical protein
VLVPSLLGETVRNGPLQTVDRLVDLAREGIET